MAFFKFPWPARSEQAHEQSPVRRSRAAQAESVEDMRRRARHRLIGAAVLVGLGVIGFPMLFDSQPRPIPVDIPIEMPDRNTVAPLVVPGSGAQHAALPAVPMASVAALPPQAQESEEELLLPAPSVIPEPSVIPAPAELLAPPVPAAAVVQAPAPTLPPPPAPMPAAPMVAPPVAAPVVMAPQPPALPAAPAPKPLEVKPEPTKPELKPAPKPAVDEAARARALLEGRPAAAPAAAAASVAADGLARMIVQVGAFADTDKAAEVRRKLESAGLKTYTQVVETKDGKRTRVRVGPFANRAEAEQAAARIKSLGLPGSVLTL